LADRQRGGEAEWRWSGAVLLDAMVIRGAELVSRVGEWSKQCGGKEVG
jgi:hypothetical protein